MQDHKSMESAMCMCVVEQLSDVIGDLKFACNLPHTTETPTTTQAHISQTNEKLNFHQKC
jgi:hypothetical protein